MKWHCGTLAKNPRQSPIYRMVHDRPKPYSRSHAWPDHIQQEACVLFHTPGISELWLCHNLRYSRMVFQIVKERLAREWPEWTKKGTENLLTATYDDALRYCQRANPGSKMPFWAVPFYLEDIKSGIGHTELVRRWGDRYKMRKKDFMYDFFHSQR